jgi:RNA-directed DNA polymerase
VLDLDVRAFFDSVPHSLLLKAVAHHTGERWVLLYISRWLKAPMQMPDGTVIAREKGTPQGSPISPLLANLFMHYAFDTWMDREFPGCPFERYADDIVAHCDTEDQARQLRAAIAERLGTLGLELHPVKTKIVYCKDANRRGDFGHTSFDFLGYTFRGRLAKGRRGYFTGFSPAISASAKKAKGKQIRDWHLNRRSSADLSSLAKSLLENSGCGRLGGGGLAGEAAGHDDDHGPVDIGLVAGGQPLVVADGPAMPGDPR